MVTGSVNTTDRDGCVELPFDLVITDLTVPGGMGGVKWRI
jgi:hypothetical protein